MLAKQDGIRAVQRDPRRGLKRAELERGLDAAHAWHVQVEHGDVDVFLTATPDCLDAVLGLEDRCDSGRRL